MKRIVIVFVGLLLVGWNGVPKNELLEETLYQDTIRILTKNIQILYCVQE